MECPYCGFGESRIIDSRPTDEGERTQRRRECLKCAKRFITYEVIETVPIAMIRKDKSRQISDRNKLLNDFLRVYGKRPISIDTFERIVDEAETMLQNSLDREVSSSLVGTYAIGELKNIDRVTHVRPVSIYRQLKDLNTFMDRLNRLMKDRN